MTQILPSVFQDGLASVASGGVTVTGQSTLWGTPEGTGNAILPGDFFGVHKGWAVRILSVDSNTQLTLANPWPGPSQTFAHYEIMLQSDNGRMQETSRKLLTKMQSGTLDSLAGLSGAVGDVIAFSAPGVLTIVPRSDLSQGLSYDVQVSTLSQRAAYDANGTGFSVLVSNVGDGRAAVYTKNSNTSGDWSAAAYVTGPVGPMPTLGVGTTTTLAPTQPATVTRNSVTGGYTFDFGIPRGRGLTWRGTYSSGTAYAIDDGVLFNGSAWICTAPTTGNVPPNPPTVSNAWWSLYALKGTDGTGTGDVVGPSVSVDSRMVEFDGTTGKLIKDGGVVVSTFIKTLLDDANASTALSTLGVSTFIKTLLDDIDGATARTTLGAGDMLKSTYDPTNINASPFAIANHTGATTTDRGTVLLGRTTPLSDGAIGTPPLQARGVSGSRAAAVFLQTGSSAGYVGFYLEGAGVVGSISGNGGTGIVYNTTSDYRRKPVQEELTGFWDRIVNTRPIRYQWDTGYWDSGFLAHEFQEQYPSSVTGEKDAVNEDGVPMYQSMQASSSEVMADIMAALQDIKKRLDAAGL